MAFYPFGGAEDGEYGGAFNAGEASSVVSSTGLSMVGSYVYQIDPVNGNPVTGQYGYTAGLSEPTFLIVGFLFRYDVAFDKAVHICELGERSASGVDVRSIRLTTDNRLAIADSADATVQQTAANYVAVDTTYPLLWYFDQRSTTNTRDILWVYKSGAWDKALDTANYGVANQTGIDAVTMGTRTGKTLPTSGGPFWIDEIFTQILNESPNSTPIGSVTTRLKMPTANGTDLNFNTGTGTNPDFNDVDEIPPDEATTYDEGDVAGDRQSYAIADATAGDKPLAVQVVGTGRRQPAGGANGANIKTYIYDGTTRDYNTQWSQSASWVNLQDSWGQKTYNTVNGVSLTETLFNTFEAGEEIVSFLGTTTSQLSQIGLEYIIEGPYALPSGFPLAPRKIVQVKQAINRANTY